MMLVFGDSSKRLEAEMPPFLYKYFCQTQSRTMETPQEYYYTYYSYEEWGRGYFGSRGCKCLPEEDIKYFGSFSDKNFNPTQKIILKSDYSTREEAYVDEIILQRYYKVVENPHFVNRAYQTSIKFYCKLSFYELSERGKVGGKRGGIKTKELGIGIHALTKEQKSENGKKGCERQKELGVGLYSLSKEERIEIGRNSLTIEQRRKNAQIVNSQRWKCLETGHISSAPGLSNYQRARGIDTSKRVRIK
jgi:hypothetical protein